MTCLILLTLLASDPSPRLDTRGRPVDPSYFPIAVWLQDPRQAKRYKDAGINLYVALWRGPTAAQLDTLRDAGMPVVCAQNSRGLELRDDPTIVAWMHGDEPDNAQSVTDPKTGRRGYGPPVPPPKIAADYQRLKKADPTRPVLLNLGQGVANDAWKGRGPGASLDDYPGYVKGADIVSFDVYPVASLGATGGDKLWYVAKGVERLVGWTDRAKPVWSCIECTHISDPERKATPAQVKSEVWMALTKGARGLIYFVHQFQPRFNEHALLDDPEMLAAVTAINRQVRELAPVLNRADAPDAGSVRSSSPDAPISALFKRDDAATYVFTVALRNEPTRGVFSLQGLPSKARAEVIGEGRSIEVTNGRFEDAYKPFEVHLYRVAAGSK